MVLLGNDEVFCFFVLSVPLLNLILYLLMNFSISVFSRTNKAIPESPRWRVGNNDYEKMWVFTIPFLLVFMYQTCLHANIVFHVSDDGRTKPEPRDGTPAVKNPSYKCLIRAQFRSNKISTVVEQRDVEKFSTAYSNLLKMSVNGLKRLKKPKKKAVATQ